MKCGIESKEEEEGRIFTLVMGIKFLLHVTLVVSSAQNK